MRSLLLLLTALSFLPLHAQQIPGTVARWSMNSSCGLIDEVAGSPVNGVLVDVSLTENRDNKPNTALLFARDSSYISLGVAEKLKLTGDRSVSFWINPTPIGIDRTGSIFFYGTGINIQYQEVGSAVRLNVIFDNTLYTQVNLLPSQWQFVTITFKKDASASTSRATVYTSGEPVESEKNKSIGNYNGAIALIGVSNQNSLTNGFRGKLDDLRVFDRTLTAAEAQNLALPVNLSFFRGVIRRGVVELKWKTQLEENVSFFYLQKSLDGVHFKPINKIDAGKYNYLAYDLTGIPSLYAWYRLQIVDKDGRTEYSHVVRVSDSADEESLSLFPNPSVKYLNVTGVSEGTIISFINSSGMVVKKEKYVEGKVVDISALMPGVYYLIFSDGRKRMTSKLIKR